MNTFLEWLLGIEPGGMAGGDSWRIDFVADYGNYVKLAMILALVFLVYLTVRSYRREGDTPRWAKVVLAILRIAVILLAMAVLLRPAVVLHFSRTLRSEVVVLIDDSLSMSFTDHYATSEARKPLADFLHVTPEELAGLSRSEIAKRILLRKGGALARLAQDHPLLILGFSTAQVGKEAYTRELAAVNAATTQPAAAPDDPDVPAELIGALQGLRGDGHETNIPAAIRDAIEKVQGRRVAGVVLISDGQITSEEAASRLTSSLAYAAQRGVNLYTVAVGDPTPPKNIAVTSLQAPPEVRRGARTEFAAVLAHRNLGGQSVTVHLLRRPADKSDWQDTGVSQQVKLEQPTGGEEDRSRGLQTVTMYLEPNEVGEWVFRAQVDPRSDEQNADDNYADAPVEVSEQKMNVLLVGGDAGWEFQYLRNFLLRQNELYRVSVWQQNADVEVNQSSSTGMKLTELPKTLPELIGSPGGKPYPGYRVVILYDPEPTVGAGGQPGGMVNLASLLKKFVTDHDGGLCYIVGSKYTDSLVGGQTAMRDLADLLPVLLRPNAINVAERISSRMPVAWPVKLTTYGLDHPVTRLGGTVEDNVRVWENLPGAFWSHPVEKVKPGARVLAFDSNPSSRTAKGEGQPVIAVQPVGNGRVVYLGSDETWRWRYVRDGYYHQRFWDNVVRYLASLKARQVVITAGGDHFTAGEKITIEVKAYDDDFNPIKTDTFEVQMIDVKTRAVETLKLATTEERDGKYRLTIPARRTGTFDLTALGGDPKRVTTKRIVIEPPRAEAQRSEANLATLRNIASQERDFLQAYEVDKLADLIPSGRLQTSQEKPRELWDSPLTLVAIVLLLAVEWILRKKYNMA